MQVEVDHNKSVRLLSFQHNHKTKRKYPEIGSKLSFGGVSRDDLTRLLLLADRHGMTETNYVQ